MADISEHDSEFEGECHYGEEGRVNLLELGDSVCLYNLLEGTSKVVEFEEGRGLEFLFLQKVHIFDFWFYKIWVCGVQGAHQIRE